MTGKKIRIAAELMALSLILAVCTGCRAKNPDNLEVLSLEKSADDKKETMQDDSEENAMPDSAEENKDRKASETRGSEDTGREDEKQIFVYVCGAVQEPGVYGLEEGARLYEAIACAGGVREDAAEESVNQAQTVVDGERLYIPTDEEVRQGLGEFLKTGISVGTGEIKSEESGGVSGVNISGAPDEGSGTDSAGKVNINTASKEELKTLNGIGDTRAESILSYRELNGPFQTIEALMQVDGIKEGVFNKMKDNITVN